jgi:hypothetical protein
MSMKTGLVTKDDLLRRFWPERYRAMQIEHDRQRGRAKEQGKLGVRQEREVASKPEKKPTAPKALTPAQKRLRTIRAVLKQAPRTTSSRELADFYHRAFIKPRESWGVSTYPEIWKTPRPLRTKLLSRFRKEKSDALRLD